MWEAPYTDLKTLAGDLCTALAPEMAYPFALFGHSMGALIAFEMARQLRRTGGPAPLHLFASACRAPQLPDSDPQLHKLPEADFVARLRAMNHGPSEIYNHPQFFEMLLPTIRADYCLCETYRYVSEPLLQCPVTAFGGLEDSFVTVEDLTDWGKQTVRRFTRVMFSGGHLFLNHHEAKLADAIVTELEITLMSGQS